MQVVIAIVEVRVIGSHSHSISLNQSGDHKSGATQSAGSHSHYSGVTVRVMVMLDRILHTVLLVADVTWEHHKQYPASQMPLTSSRLALLHYQ